MPSTIQVEQLRFSRGCRKGLAEATATCQWVMEGSTALTPEETQRLRRAAAQLAPDGTLFGIGEADWPQAFLIGPATGTVADWGVAITVAIQRLARDPVGRGRVLASEGGALRVAMPWQREPVFKAAMGFALRFLMIWLAPDAQARLAELSAKFVRWLSETQAQGLSPNSMRFALAAVDRSIPLSVGEGLLRLGWGVNTERMDSSFTGRSPALSVRLARNKHWTSQVLNRARVPVPHTSLVAHWEAGLEMARRFGWPVVVKPSNQEQGYGVVPGIRDEATLRRAFDAAEKLSPQAVIVEKHVDGEDYRVLVVGGRMMVATRRIAGSVVGDGSRSVEALMAQVNADPRRGHSKGDLLIVLTLDEEALSCLAEQGLAPASVPEPGRFVRLRRTANISTGGTAFDVTPQVHPDNRLICERAAQALGLDIAGVDFLCPDISRSWREIGGAICEVNAQPGFRPHWLAEPTRDVNGEILDWLFRGKSARIPTAAVTGTNGKSTVCLMLHHIWTEAGYRTGVCATSGVWIGHDLISTENLSGYPGARVILGDPTAQAAVIEIARKGQIYYGHPCDRYDVSALLNIQDDHIGVDGIDSMEAMAALKAEVLALATRAVVLNAEDPLCLSVRNRAGATPQVLVARDAAAPALREHLAAGGAGVHVSQHEGRPWIVLADKAGRTPLVALADIPATMNGLLHLNESNALFAAAVAWAQGLPLPVIARALASFTNSYEHNPGRFNFVEGFPFQVLLDFGHNPDGVRELCKVVARMPVPGRKHLLTTKVGNRHRSHIEAVVQEIMDHFDRLVVSCTPDVVNEAAEWAGANPTGDMLDCWRETLKAHGMDPGAVAFEADPALAVPLVLAAAQPGDLVVILGDPKMVPVLRQLAAPGRTA